MKTTRSIGLVMMILLLFAGGLNLSAQEKEEDLQKKIREKEMMERKKMLEEQQEQMKVMQKDMEFRERELEHQAREAARAPRVVSVFPGAEGEPFIFNVEQRNQSQLTLRKTFTGNTDTSSGEFDVEEGVRQFRCVINGNVRAGEITIKLEYPDGKVFKDLTINSSADISFSQSMSFKEEEANRYTGSWKYEIEADQAEGNYMLQIMTN